MLILEPFEHELLVQLPEALRSLLEEAAGDDPALRRLFPPVAPDDGAVDAEVRALIHDDLLHDRLDALEEVSAILARASRRRGQMEIELADDEPALLLGVLNDVRLTLGARLGIEHLDRDAVDQDHPMAQTLALMDHLAWVQEELIAAIDPGSVVRTGDEPGEEP